MVIVRPCTLHPYFESFKTETPHTGSDKSAHLCPQTSNLAESQEVFYIEKQLILNNRIAKRMTVAVKNL